MITYEKRVNLFEAEENVVIYMLKVQQFLISVKRIVLFHHLQKGALEASADGLGRQWQPASAVTNHLFAKLSVIQNAAILINKT